jgi:hypothetical protein
VSSRRLALLLAACTAAVLAAMVGVSIVTGATQEAHEHYKPPAEYAAGLLAHPGALRLLFALDVAFLVLYTAFFAALAKYLRELGRPFVWLALGAMLGVTVLDIVEDHHILALLAMAERGRPIDDGAIAFQDVLSSTKFTVSYLALFLYGLAVPRTTKLAWALALFLTAGTLVTGVIGYAVPESLDSTRWLGFLVGFGLAGAWLRSAPEPA